MSRREYIPKEYQPPITNFILDNPRGNVWARMGMGKTVASLRAIDILEFVGEVSYKEPVLVVAPFRVAVSTWPDEVEKWAFAEHLEIVCLCGDGESDKGYNAKQREKALQQRAHIYTINYENLPWLIDYFKKKKLKWPFRTLFADESTKLKSFRLNKGGQRARALARYAHTRIRRFINLTGTPSPNGLKDLWGQNWYVDAGARLGRTHGAFVARWFQRGFDGFNIEPLPFAQEQIEDKLRDCSVSLDPRDYFDLHEPIVQKIWVDLPKKARRLYDEMEREMYIEIERKGVEAFNSASRSNKCSQLANGAVYTDEKAETFSVVHDVKLDALEEIYEEAAGMPVLVAYHFKSDLKRLKKRFPFARVLDKKKSTMRDWNKGKIPMLLAHPDSCGHGLNLQDGGNILVYFAIDWNLELHEQILERIGPVRQLQSGHDRPVFIYYIMARHTIDATKYKRLKTKRDVQDILMEAMKLYKNRGA